MSKVATREWIAAFRQRLIKDGAVAFYPEKSEADLAANRATDGLYPGMPGSGLYSKGAGVYEAHVECSYERGYEDCSKRTADEWREYLSSREPHAVYLRHYTQTGIFDKGGTAEFHWRHVIVVFKVTTAD